MSSAGSTPMVTVPNELAWDEAFLRVESYLRALHVESRVLLNRIAADILNEARASAPNDSSHPVTLAMTIANARLDGWFAKMVQSPDALDGKFRVRGRLALVMADSNGEWANYFLTGETPPAALVTAMNRPLVTSAPDVRFSNMAPAPLEFEMQEGRREPQPAMRWVVARAAGTWLAIIGLMGMAWAASH